MYKDQKFVQKKESCNRQKYNFKETRLDNTGVGQVTHLVRWTTKNEAIPVEAPRVVHC